MIFFIRRRDGRDDLFQGEEIGNPEPEQRNGMVNIQVGEAERRFGIPVKLRIGGGRGDDFKVNGARRHELTLVIKDGRERFRHRKGMFGRLTGAIYRSQSFTLKNGTRVTVRLGNHDSSLHRYLKGV